MDTRYFALQVVIFVLAFSSVQCWNQDELDMYDLIEELGMKPNFYEILGLSENATSAEIRRTFRQLSLIHHPDKTDAEDAEIKFRRLVGVYEILRDSGRREMYDKFLVEGMPDWRSALYYYRRARKMGMLEITIILFLITTIGQYITAWAGYKERRFTIEEAVRTRFKRERKQGKDIDFDALVDKYMADNEMERPSWWNTLPFQLVRAARWLVCSAPFELMERVRSEKQRREEERLAAEEREREEQEQREELQRQREKKQKIKERRRQRLQELPEAGPRSAADEAAAATGTTVGAAPARTWSTAKSGPWADEDLVELARLVKRHPGGTPERWEVIAEALERTVAEVTKMARIIRDRPHMVPVSSSAQTHTADGQQVDDSVLEPAVVPEKKKVKTRAAAATGDGAEEAAWSQTQQKALEAALAQFPKGASERWERVAKAVPGKTKEECMLRFKYLADMLKKRKEAEAKKEEREEAAGVEGNESVATPSAGADTSSVNSSAAERCSTTADS